MPPDCRLLSAANFSESEMLQNRWRKTASGEQEYEGTVLTRRED